MTTSSGRRSVPERSVVYGRNPVQEALRGRRRVLRVWETDERPVGSEPLPAQVTVSTVSRQELDRICGSPDHQGLAAEVEPYPYSDPEELLSGPQALLLALDQVQDPHNLGAVCRSAECAGATGVVIPERRSALITPAVCRASAGAVEHLAVARVRNLADFLTSARQRGAWVYGAEAGAEVDYGEPDYRGRTVLVLGSEGKGMRPRVRAACDQLISLPLSGRMRSLNVSAAAAVLLYEAGRRRREAQG